MKYILKTISLLVLIGILGVIYSWIQFKRCLITLDNQTGNNISNITVSVRGGSYNIDIIGTGQSKTIRVYPQGESGVELSFIDSNLKLNKWQGGYINSSGGYRMHITIGLDNKVDEKTRLWPRKN